MGPSWSFAITSVVALGTWAGTLMPQGRSMLRGLQGVGFPVRVRGCFVTLCHDFFVDGGAMFFHDKRLQYRAECERPDPLFAKKLQEVLGGQFGEMSVMM